MDISHDKHNYAREYLKGIDNVEFVLMDVYNTMWNFEDKDSVVFIDIDENMLILQKVQNFWLQLP